MHLCANGRHDIDETGTDHRGRCGECRRIADRESKRARRKPAPRPQAIYAEPVLVNDWQARARCDESTAELFFDTELYYQAAVLCRDCPVRRQCLEDNLYEQYGYAGGMTPKQRQTLVKRRRQGGMAAEYIPIVPDRPKPAKRPGMPLVLTDKDTTEIDELWNSGQGLRKVSSLTGIPRSVIHRYIMSTGQGRTADEQKALSDKNRGVNKYAIEGKEMTYKLIKEGYTIPEIAEMIDRSLSTVYGIRRALIRKGFLTEDD